MKYLFSEVIATLLLLFSFSSCEKDNNRKENVNELKNAFGYIVGFDPCTINSYSYRIGYVFISSDCIDTLITYNLSDSTYQMPSNIILNKTDTIYCIPWENFKNYSNSAYFPKEVRYNYRVQISYVMTPKEEIKHIKCSANINASQLIKQFINNQAIIKSVKKY